jgi:hypothetical protein
VGQVTPRKAAGISFTGRTVQGSGMAYDRQGEFRRRLAAPIAIASIAGLTACAPVLEMREGAQTQELRSLVQQFCDATASGDLARIADVFEPSLAEAIRDASAPPPLASRALATGCRPGKVWYIGGSRRVMEVQYDGFADRLDLWLSGQGKAFDLTYGDGGKSLRERLGLKPAG